MRRCALRSLSSLLFSLSIAACTAPRAPREMPPLLQPPPAQALPRGGDADRAPILPESASAITFERIAKFPEPGWQVPRALQLSPDGKLVTYLKSEDKSDKMSLYAFDASGERVLVRASDLVPDKPLSREEELRGERQRKRITGVTDYAWAEKTNVMVIPLGGDVFVRGADGAIERVTETPEPELDPQLCPTGTDVAYVRGSEIYATNLVGKKHERPVTQGARPGITRGQSDFNGQEEFDESHGFFWSPDCKRMAYLEVDEHAVAEVPVMGYRNQAPDLMMQRYPLAGGKNPSVTLYLSDFAAVTSRAVKLPGDAPVYMGRFKFSPDGSALFFETLGRDQSTLSILRVDMATSKVTELWHEKPEGWAEMKDLEVARGGKELVVVADHGGHDHLLRIDAVTGKELGWLTSGDWDVTKLEKIYDTPGTAYFLGTKDAPIGRQLFAVSLSGTEPPVRITQTNGTVDFVAFGDNRMIDVVSSTTTPPKVRLETLKGEETGVLPLPHDPEIDSLHLRAPGLFTVDAAPNVKLYGHVLAPRNVDASKKYPLVLVVYGGPGVQTVMDRWVPSLFWQHLADRGFFVAQLDNRGGSGRGQAFAAPIAGRLGEIELKDQLAGLAWLEKNAPIDPGRVAIYGHSYGGFMAAKAMFEEGAHFKAGVSASPVSDFRLYDSGYTERYLGLPSSDALGYDGTDLAKNAGGLTGRLFLIHALMDENVHFDNSARLIDALVEKQKPFDLLVLPGERHGYRNPKTKEYVYRRIAGFLAEALR